MQFKTLVMFCISLDLFNTIICFTHVNPFYFQSNHHFQQQHRDNVAEYSCLMSKTNWRLILCAHQPSKLPQQPTKWLVTKKKAQHAIDSVWRPLVPEVAWPTFLCCSVWYFGCHQVGKLISRQLKQRRQIIHLSTFCSPPEAICSDLKTQSTFSLLVRVAERPARRE